jgi:diguanylate cyclase (GGDEF)-like protein
MSIYGFRPPAENAEAETAGLRQEAERLAAELDEARAAAARLEALAHEDALTGVLNRRGFLRDLSRAISYVGRYGIPAALLLLDLDAFKPVNDRYGHITGDTALRHVAGVLRSHLRASDSIGRLGGDEFVLIVWQADEAAARHKAALLEEAIAAAPLSIGGATLTLRASIGATLLQGADGPEDALARADRAMYARKATRPGIRR